MCYVHCNIAQLSKQIGLSHLSGFVEELLKLGKPHEDLNGTLQWYPRTKAEKYSEHVTVSSANILCSSCDLSNTVVKMQIWL